LEHPDLNVTNVEMHGVGHMSLPIMQSVVHGIGAALAHLDSDGSTGGAGARRRSPAAAEAADRPHRPGSTKGLVTGRSDPRARPVGAARFVTRDAAPSSAATPPPLVELSGASDGVALLAVSVSSARPQAVDGDLG
jgi:hypothetical protein